MNDFTTITQLDLFNICLDTYGQIDYLFKLMSDNNQSDINAIIPTNTVIEFDNEFKIFNPIIISNIKTNVIIDPVSEYTVRTNQTIFDLSLQLYGNINQIFKIISDNTNGRLLDNLKGKSINFTSPGFQMTNDFLKYNTIIVTGDNNLRSFNRSFNISFH